MSAGWVGVSVRARAMTSRRLGRARVRTLATSPSLDDALAVLAHTPYAHDLRGVRTLAAAQRGVVETMLWNTRVLAGWAPRQGVAMLRALTSALEAANVRDRIRALDGQEVPPPYRLGGLSTAWPRLSRVGSERELREVLSTSAWGDPAADPTRDLWLFLTASCADRVIAAVPPAATWAAGGIALLVAQQVVRDGRELTGAARRAAARVLGARPLTASSLPDLAARVPSQARWAVTGVTDPAELWQAEARWWARVERDGFALARGSADGPGTMVAAVALLAADAWRVRGALELAARGGGPLEVFDALA